MIAKFHLRRKVYAVFLLSLIFSCIFYITAEAEDIIQLRLAHVMSFRHPYHLGALKFKEIVETDSQGRIQIEIFPSGQLGRQKNLAEMVSAGQVDFCMVWPGILESYDPSFGIISLPFLFRNEDHLWCVVDGEIGQELFQPLATYGLKILSFFHNGTYNIFSKSKVRYPEDMKGIKLRVPPSALFVEVGKILGSVVITTDYTEVASAFHNGAIDAEIQSSINVREGRHYEFADNFCQIGMSYLLEPLVMSDKSFSNLSSEDQGIILNAAREATNWQRLRSENQEDEADKYLMGKGVQYFTPYYRSEWLQAMTPLYKNHPEWNDLIIRIRKLVEN